jgi:BirA family biotin operon repressor/biotin-[acetyl-CoA-carboxylase] ligase
LSKNNPCEGTVITTENQVEGRGQIGSKWESEAGKNIILSIILRPNFLPAREQFLLNQAITLGVVNFIQYYITTGVKIKWPNDIYVHKKKVAGILIQNQLSGSRIQSSVIGIGLNINQVVFLSDAPNPTSFKLLTAHEFQIEQLIPELCRSIEQRYLQLKQGKHAILQNDYLKNLFQYQQTASYQKPNETTFQGRIIGISPFGKLKIEHNQGIEFFDIKTVKFIL